MKIVAKIAAALVVTIASFTAFAPATHAQGGACNRWIAVPVPYFYPSCPPGYTLDVQCAGPCTGSYLALSHAALMAARARCVSIVQQLQIDLDAAQADFDDPASPGYQDPLYLQWQRHQAHLAANAAQHANFSQWKADLSACISNYASCVSACCL